MLRCCYVGRNQCHTLYLLRTIRNGVLVFAFAFLTECSGIERIIWYYYIPYHNSGRLVLNNPRKLPSLISPWVKHKQAKPPWPTPNRDTVDLPPPPWMPPLLLPAKERRKAARRRRPPSSSPSSPPRPSPCARRSRPSDPAPTPPPPPPPRLRRRPSRSRWLRPPPHRRRRRHTDRHPPSPHHRRRRLRRRAPYPTRTSHTNPI